MATRQGLDTFFPKFYRSLEQCSQLQRNADFGDPGPSVSELLREIAQAKTLAKKRRRVIALLSAGHVQGCYCCPFVKIAVNALEPAQEVVAMLSTKMPDICSKGLLGNTRTWGELLGINPEEMIGNGLQHCIARMGAIEKLWGKHLSQKAINDAIAFLVQRMDTLPKEKHPRLKSAKLRDELWELAWKVARKLARQRKKPGLTEKEVDSALSNLGAEQARALLKEMAGH